MTIKVRPAGSFRTIDEAMARVVEIKDRAALLEYLREHFDFWKPTEENVTIEKYGVGVDARIGWDTHLICVDGNAALFADGPLESSHA